GEASCLQRAAKVPVASRCDRLRVDFERQMRLLAREHLAGVNDDAGIGDATVLAERGRIGRIRITPASEESAMRSAFEQELGRLYPAVSIGDAAILNAEGVHHAVAEKPMIVLIARRKLWVRAVAVKCAAQILRNLAADRQIVGVGFEQDGGKASGQKWMVGKRLAHDLCFAQVGSRVVERVGISAYSSGLAVTFAAMDDRVLAIASRIAEFAAPTPCRSASQRGSL